MKLIDWNGMPKGTMTDKGPLAQTCKGNQSAYVFAWGHGVAPVLELKLYPVSALRIIRHHAADWIADEACPSRIPNGLLYEYVHAELDVRLDSTARSTLRNIGNFRIVGVDRAAGFTDNPDEATE